MISCHETLIFSSFLSIHLSNREHATFLHFIFIFFTSRITCDDWSHLLENQPPPLPPTTQWCPVNARNKQNNTFNKS